jgi:hypothetical protein
MEIAGYLSLGLMLSLASPAQALAGAEMPLYIGMLEGPQTAASPPDPPVSSQPHVRIAFRKSGEVWQALPTDFGSPAALAQATHGYPASVQWTVVLNGKALGHLSSRNPDGLRWYADIGTHVITSNAADIPIATKPLLLVSAPHYEDPAGWQSSTLTKPERRLVAAALRRKVPATERCKAPEELPIQRVPYDDDKIAIIGVYRSNRGELLVGERLQDPQANCGFFNDQHFFSYWFVRHGRQRIQYLDSNMTPVVAADLDGSGQSVWIFLTARGEDEQGYELFYNDFGRRSYFHWTYH